MWNYYVFDGFPDMRRIDIPISSRSWTITFMAKFTMQTIAVKAADRAGERCRIGAFLDGEAPES